MVRWQRLFLRFFGLGLLAVWPARWLLQGLPDGWLAVEGGGAWPLHLTAEAAVAVLCMWAAGAGRARMVRPAGLIALGTLVYSIINSLSYGVYGDPWHVGVAGAKLLAALVLAAALAGQAHWAGMAALPRWPGALLALVGLGMIGFWSLQVVGAGIMKDGLWTAEGNAYLLFHLAAEGLAGLIALVSGGGLLLRNRGMVSPALVGAGAVLYAAVNSAGWAVLNDAGLVVVFAVSSLAVVAAAAGLWRFAVSARRSGSWAA